MLSEQHIDILAVNITTNKQRQFTGKITFESPDPTHLQHVMNLVRRVPGVYDAFRVPTRPARTEGAAQECAGALVRATR